MPSNDCPSETGPFKIGSVQAFDLICRHDLYLWLPVVKSDYAGDADDFPLDHGKSLIGRYCRPGCNEPGERLIGVVSSEIDKCGTQWAGHHTDNATSHFDFFADILDSFRVLYHHWLARSRHNRAEKQAEH